MMIEGNFYFWLISGALLLNYALNRLADSLNVRSLDQAIPAELNAVVDPQKVERMRAYTREKTRFHHIQATAELALILAAWWSGALGALVVWTNALGWHPILEGLLFFAIVGLVGTVLSWPFELWWTFGIEERFEFNRTTPTTFWLDRLKALALAVVLVGPLLALVLWAFERWGPYAWLIAWIAASLFVVTLGFLGPRVLMPLFHRFEPLRDGALRDRILALLERVRFPVSDVFSVDGSRRSSKANAFFAGFGSNKRIGLFDTLIEQYTAEEIEAVVAHEAGHWKRGHIRQGLVLSVASLAVMFACAGWLIGDPALSRAFGAGAPTVYGGLLFFTFVYSPLSQALGVIANWWSRKNEYEADRFAAESTGSAEPLVSALSKLSTDSLSHLTPHPLFVWLNYTHPPVVQRIRALRAVPLAP